MKLMGNKKRIALFGILLTVIVIGVFVFSRMRQTSKEEVLRAAGSATVTITGSGFNPETVTVKKGQKVEWINVDVVPHQIAPDPHPVHSSYPPLSDTDALQPNESMTFTFDAAGTYTYHDESNPLTFKGVVIVE